MTVIDEERYGEDQVISLDVEVSVSVRGTLGNPATKCANGQNSQKPHY